MIYGKAIPPPTTDQNHKLNAEIERLKSQQRPLEEELARILYENLWALYARNE